MQKTLVRSFSLLKLALPFSILFAAFEYLINEAAPRQLLRLRKDELVNLYTSAGLSDDAESLTKQEIVDAVVAARDDVAEIPPSSPRGGSTDYSSDDGNLAEDDETDIVPVHSTVNGLRRRATTNDLDQSNSKPPKGRSFSMDFLLAQSPSFEGRKATKPSGNRVHYGNGGIPPRYDLFFPLRIFIFHSHCEPYYQKKGHPWYK
jgi:hypothetical protein